MRGREEELEEKLMLKKTLVAKAQLQSKAVALLMEKAACFESNQYKDVLMKDLDTLLQWYDIPKEKMKKVTKEKTRKQLLKRELDISPAEIKKIDEVEIKARPKRY